MELSQGRQLVIGNALTIDQVQNRVARGRGVLAPFSSDARNLVDRLGPVRPAEVSRGGLPGFFWHYHPVDRPDVHIWFSE